MGVVELYCHYFAPPQSTGITLVDALRSLAEYAPRSICEFDCQWLAARASVFPLTYSFCGEIADLKELEESLRECAIEHEKEIEGWCFVVTTPVRIAKECRCPGVVLCCGDCGADPHVCVCLYLNNLRVCSGET